jgi:hypothetical protein
MPRQESAAAVTWLQTQVPFVLLNGWSLAQRMGVGGCAAACRIVDSAANVVSVISTGEPTRAMHLMAICAGFQGSKGCQAHQHARRCYYLPAATSAWRATHLTNRTV